MELRIPDYWIPHAAPYVCTGNGSFVCGGGGPGVGVAEWGGVSRSVEMASGVM